MASSEEKLDLLRSLLKDNPELGMKEANVVIREQFGTGVAPPQYSKVKKELEGDSSESKPKASKGKKASEEEVVETKPKAAKPKKKAKKEKKTESEKVEAESDTSNELESFFDGKAAEAVKEKSEEPVAASEEQKEEVEDSQVESETVEVEEENLEPVPTFPVKLEVSIDEADTVHITGSFNKWKVEEFPLVKTEENKWVFDGELPEGEHFYKFVIDKKLWHLDLSKEYFTDTTGISHKLIVSAS